MKLLEKQKKCLQFISPLVPLVIFAIIIVFIPEKAHAEKIYEVLNPAKNTGPSETVRNVWTQIRNIINYLGMAFLIYVAFMNILRIEMNSYAIKKVLPALIMGVILANFSFLICRFFVDLANVGMDLLINSPGGVNAMSSGNNFGIAGAFALKIDHAKFLTDVDKLNYSYIFAALLFCIVEFAGAIIILILSFLFFLRNYMIYFLVALSPLAFMVSGIPMAKSAWNQWWTQFTKWTFMPIVSLFWLWIGSLWLEPFRNLSGSGTGSGWLLAVIFAGVCFYLAITTPFKMGGAIMGQWGKLGKQAWGKTGGAAWSATGGAAGKWAKDSVKGYYDRQKGFVREKFYAGGIGKRFREGQEQFKLKNEMPNMIRDKSVADARKLASFNQLSQHDAAWWGRPENKAVFSRLKSVTRGGIQEEMQNPRWKNMTVAQLADNIPLNAAGNPVSPHDIATGNFHASVTAARRASIAANPVGAIEESGAAITEMQRRARMGTNNPDRTLAENYLNGAAGAARAGQPAMNRGGDPAFYGSSVVGNEIGENSPVAAAQEAQSHNRQIESIAGEHGQALVQAANHGTEAFDDAVQSTGIDMSRISPGAQQALRDAFTGIRDKRDNLVADFVKQGEEQLDEEMVGAKMAFDQLGSTRGTAAANARMLVLDKSASEGLDHLAQGNIEEAKKIGQKFNLAVTGTNEEIAAELQKTFSQMRSGIKNIQASGAAALPNFSAVDAAIRTAKTPEIEAAAQTQVASHLAVSSTPPPQSLSQVTVERVHDNSEALGELTNHFNDMMSQVAQARGVSQAPQTTPASASSFFREMSAGMTPGTSVAAALADPRAMDKLAMKIGNATAAAQKKAGIGTEIRPPQNVNVTNVTNVAGSGSTAPGAPSAGPKISTPEPLKTGPELPTENEPKIGGPAEPTTGAKE